MPVLVLLSKGAQKDVDGLPVDVHVRVIAKLDDLRNYPNVAGIKALKGAHRGEYRVRVGSFRIVFTIGTGAITVIAVDARKDVY